MLFAFKCEPALADLRHSLKEPRDIAARAITLGEKDRSSQELRRSTLLAIPTPIERDHRS